MSKAFTILTASNEEIKPLKSSKKVANIPTLRLAQSYIATPQFGLMHFQELNLKNFTLWLSHYDMKGATRIRFRLEKPILEGHITLKNRTIHSLEKETNVVLETGEFNITHAPATDYVVYFQEEGRYITLDIQMALSFLEKLEDEFSVLDTFIDRIYKGSDRPIRLFENRSFIGSEMELLVEKIIQHQGGLEATRSYTEALATELILLFLLRSFQVPNKKLINPSRYTDQMLYLRDLLKQQADTYDFEDLYDTEMQLAEKVGLSLYQLKTCFKSAFGMGPYQMLKDFRFQKANRLLIDTKLPMLDIALKTGYQSAESFIKAYTKRFGLSPAKYRKKM